MKPGIERRTFLGLGLGLAFGSPALHRGWPFTAPPGERSADLPPDRPPAALAQPSPSLDAFPRQDPATVMTMVGASHGNVARVRELLARQPALARATVDWGFGDWETALGAAAHTGQREIAELLIANGARPTLFSATMLGQLAVVRAMVEANPGAQRILGPHSLTLLHHARSGGAQARQVREYLESLGDADRTPVSMAVSPSELATYAGTYTFGTAPSERLELKVDRGALLIARPGATPRGLRCLSPGEFFPVGAEQVRLRFRTGGGRVELLEVFDPDLLVSARRVDG